MRRPALWAGVGRCRPASARPAWVSSQLPHRTTRAGEDDILFGQGAPARAGGPMVRSPLRGTPMMARGDFHRRARGRSPANPGGFWRCDPHPDLIARTWPNAPGAWAPALVRAYTPTGWPSSGIEMTAGCGAARRARGTSCGVSKMCSGGSRGLRLRVHRVDQGEVGCARSIPIFIPRARGH
jgi:hypothetical protein